ncbi:ASCH domain-containing protein, partial [Acinetobacter baumannii]
PMKRQLKVPAKRKIYQVSLDLP